MANILHGDCLDVLPTLAKESINCVVTSPPYYGLRDYGEQGQLGQEDLPTEYIEKMVEVFRLVREVLRPDGTVWLNLGDCYSGVGRGAKATGLQKAARATKQRTIPGLPSKNLLGIPWRVAIALQEDDWYLRQDIIWHKPNPMPESVTDRCTKSHEYIFLLSKSEDYYFDMDSIKERTTETVNGPKRFGGGKYGDNAEVEARTKSGNNYKDSGWRHKRSVWTIGTPNYPLPHFATFPTSLVRPCVLAGSPPGGCVLDPFFGTGTVGEVAAEEGRDWIGIEINEEYCEIAENRTAQRGLFE